MTEATAQANDIVQCPHCGRPQEPTGGDEPKRCDACGQPPIAPPTPPRVIRQLSMPRSKAALEDLVRTARGPQAPGMIDEILSFERRASWGAAFIPFLGPWLVWNGGVTEQQTARLRSVSIVTTGLTVAALFLLLPALGIRPATTEEGVKSDIGVLVEIAKSYRAEHGAYPDVEVWLRTADLPDPRFFDPWGRRYEYWRGGDSVTIGTTGEDGVSGGTGDDADVFVTIPAAPAN
jgi:hypothetical protein